MSLDHALGQSHNSTRRLTGYHVLAAFVGFFSIVFAMNSVMIYQAVTTFGGLETKDAYRKGLAYNERIADAEAQAKLGWEAAVTVAAERDGVTVQMTGRDREPITGLDITGTIGRAATNRFDRAVTLRETAPGIYTISGEAPMEAGAWIASLSATRAVEDSGEQRLDIRRRLWVTP